MITIKQFVFNPFSVNSFVLYNEEKDCIIIDPANYSEEEFNTIVNFIESNKLNPKFICCTHGHFDHLAGCISLKEKFKIPFKSHKNEKELILNAHVSGGTFGFKINQINEIDSFIDENNKVTFGSSELDIIHIPGHSTGSIGYLSKDQKFLISGDVLFNSGIGRTDLPGGNFNTLIESIKQKIFTLSEDTIVYPGHGPTTTVADEKNYNPYT